MHLSAIQHPIVCDELYAPSRTPILGFTRLALHAYSIRFIHPATGEELKFEAPLPADFIAAEEAIAAGGAL